MNGPWLTAAAARLGCADLEQHPRKQGLRVKHVDLFARVLQLLEAKGHLDADADQQADQGAAGQKVRQESQPQNGGQHQHRRDQEGRKGEHRQQQGVEIRDHRGLGDAGLAHHLGNGQGSQGDARQPITQQGSAGERTYRLKKKRIESPPAIGSRSRSWGHKRMGEG